MITTINEALRSTSPNFEQYKFFQIKNGHIKASNEMTTYYSPIQLDIDCTPNAKDLASAISKCSDTTSFKMNPSGKLNVKSGAFRANINCLADPHPIETYPVGITATIDGESLIAMFKKLVPFISTETDNDRVWTNGLLLRGGKCYVTNNVILIQHETGLRCPIHALIPLKAILSVLKIEGYPTRLQFDSNSITFHYDTGKWFRSLLYTQKWDRRIFDMFNFDEPCQSIEPEIFKGISMVKSDTDNFGKVYFHENGVSSMSEIDTGLFYEIPGLNLDGVYNAAMFSLLESVADSIDFSTYPQPLPFQGESLKGVIVGMVK